MHAQCAVHLSMNESNQSICPVCDENIQKNTWTISSYVGSRTKRCMVSGNGKRYHMQCFSQQWLKPNASKLSGNTSSTDFSNLKKSYYMYVLSLLGSIIVFTLLAAQCTSLFYRTDTAGHRSSIRASAEARTGLGEIRTRSKVGIATC